jgi:hypothetical protein
MRRFFTIGHTYLLSAGTRACRHTCCPRCFFGFSLLCPIHRAGALPQFRLSPLFHGGQQNGTYNHSW